MIDSNTRLRYCNIRATTLEEVLETCNRHIKNITVMEQDAIDCCDLSTVDKFYMDMFAATWTDLRDDVQKMLTETK